MKIFRHTITLFTVTIVSIGLMTGILALLSTAVQAAPTNELDVCPTCTYTTIQTAVNVANPGDTIRVAQGTYQDTITATGLLTTTVLITKDLTLLGGYSPDFQTHDPTTYETIIDGQNIAKGIYVFGASAHIEGFTIINGLNQGILVRVDFDSNPGGASIINNHIHDNPGTGIVFYQATGEVLSNTLAYNVWEGVALSEATANILYNTIAHNNLSGIWAGNTTTTIGNNQIISNTAEGGGGITLDDVTVFTVTHNTIANNQAQLYGGGGIAIFDGATGSIAFNTIADNVSADCCGGGITAYANGDLIISNNTITANYSQSGGGGLDLNPDDTTFDTTTFITITENSIQENIGSYGSGIALNNVNGGTYIAANDIRLNEMVANTPDFQSGGIHIWGSSGPTEVVNNLIVQNANRALKAANFSQIDVINNTMAGNGAMGVETFAWPVTPTLPYTTTVVNNIVVGHDECGVTGFNGVVMYVDYNLLHDNDTDICLLTAVPPHANIFAHPQFINIAAGNYRLQSNSPAIDSGTTGPNIPDVDIEGTTRPQGSGIDMGAYEAIRYQLFLPGVANPPVIPSDNFIIENRPFGQGYSFYSGDIHTWLSTTDGWGFAPQGPSNVEFYRWNGTSWNLYQTLPSGGPNFSGTGLEMISPTDGWAVGSTIARQSGDSWVVYGSPVTESLNAISMVSANDGWIVGEAGTILHWDGLAWTAVASPTSENIWDIEMLQSDHGWAVGGNGTILRWNGSVWSLVTSPVSASFGELDMIGINEGWIPYYQSETATYGVLHIAP